MGESTTDVIVIGAGASGLMATHVLEQAGRSVRLLEARDRLGGRLETVTMRDGSAVDVGGQWLGRDHARVLALVRRFRISTFPQPYDGKKIVALGGRMRTHTGDIPQLPLWSLLDLQQGISRLERMARRVPVHAPWLARDAERLDGETVERFAHRLFRTADARRAIEAAVRAIHAVEPREISPLQLLWYAHANVSFMKLATIRNGAQETRFLRGAVSLVHALAEVLKAKPDLGAHVQAVVQDEQGVRVRCVDGREFRAKRLVVAVAPPALRGVDFRPALPEERVRVQERMEMGCVIKVIVRYARPFWRDAGFSGEAVLDDPVVQLVFDETVPGSGHGALVAFLNGDAARRWTGRPAAERHAAVLGTLARCFGPEALAAEEVVERDWLADPLSRGCYVGQFGPGGWVASGPALREPCGRIHWAGTETATVFPGYIEGALEAGERAAREVLAG